MCTDPAYFMKKYCMIQHPIKGKIPFDLYDFQEKSVNEFKDNRFNIILKAQTIRYFNSNGRVCFVDDDISPR